MRAPLPALFVLVLGFGCGSTEPPPKNSPAASTLAPEDARLDYQKTLASLAKARQDLSKRYQAAEDKERTKLLKEAHQTLFTALREKIFPAWYGTAWDFSGTTQTPGEGEIACGYFVSTTLRDAGLKVERVKMAQQASEKIIMALTPPEHVWRFRNKGRDPVLEKVKAEGEGLYLVGLDNHVGYLMNHKGAIQFCHSSYLGDSVVACEPAETADALRSNYYVLGDVLTDALLRRWLSEEPFKIN